MSKIKLFDTEITLKDFSFNTICDLEDMGLSLADLGVKPMSFIRAYLTISSKLTVDEIGNLMGQHLASGESFDDIINAINDAMEDSDFFRSLNKTEEKKTTKSQSKKAKEE